MSSPEVEREQAVIVGAPGALGHVIVDSLIAAGLQVIGIARSGTALGSLSERHGQDFVPLVADLATDDAIDIVQKAVTGPVAIVVHAPGVPVAGGIKAASTDALIEACNIKVGGFVRLVRAVEPFLRRRSRLVAIGGHYGFEPTAYAATAGVANAALANVVRQMSWAYGESGVTCHLVAPGPADTERLHNVARARGNASGQSSDDVIADMKAESAIGALVEPAQVAWAVRMLLSPEADALAGSSLMLDAGRRRGLP